MRTAVFVVAALIAGCSMSRADRVMLKNKDPIATFETDKTPEQYIGCLNPIIMGVNPSAHLLRDGNAHVLRTTTFANTQVVVEAHPTASGSRVIYRSRFRTGSGEYTEAVKSCQ